MSAQKTEIGGIPKETLKPIAFISKNDLWAYPHEELKQIYQIILEATNDKIIAVKKLDDKFANNDDSTLSLSDECGSKRNTQDDPVDTFLYDHHLATFNLFNEARKRIETGRFSSYCIKCGKLIPLERVKFSPENPCCINCVSKR